jgi:hypothetical protein
LCAWKLALAHSIEELKTAIVEERCAVEQGVAADVVAAGRSA